MEIKMPENIWWGFYMLWSVDTGHGDSPWLVSPTSQRHPIAIGFEMSP